MESLAKLVVIIFLFIFTAFTSGIFFLIKKFIPIWSKFHWSIWLLISIVVSFLLSLLTLKLISKINSN